MLIHVRLRKIACVFGRRAAQDCRGVAALEFALIAPLMILLYVGLAQLSSAIIASRHTNHAASSLGDLVSQCSNINDSDLGNIFSAANDMMAPLNVNILSSKITSVEVIDNNQTTQAQWSRVQNGSDAGAYGFTAYALNAPVTLPANLVSNKGDSVIVAETYYTYTFGISPFLSKFTGNTAINIFKFDDLSYFKPRKSSLVTYTGTGAGGTSTQTSCYS